MEIFLLFVLYSFFGCILEEVYYFVLHREYMSKRMLINLPLCPVYGIACLLLGTANRQDDSAAMLFCTGFLVVSATELAFYLVSRRVYGVRLWDYSGLRFQLMGGISLVYSVMWGFCNIFFAKVLDPMCRVWVGALPQSAKLLLTAFLAAYLYADLKQTHIELKKFSSGEKSLISDKLKYIKLNN